MPLAARVLRMPIWAKPRAAPPPSAKPMTGRRTLPRPTFSPLEPFAPRPFKISSTETLLPRASPHSRVGAVLPLRQNEGKAWFIPFGEAGGRSVARRGCLPFNHAGVNRVPKNRIGRYSLGIRRLEFAAFSVKSRWHDSRG